MGSLKRDHLKVVRKIEKINTIETNLAVSIQHMEAEKARLEDMFERGAHHTLAQSARHHRLTHLIPEMRNRLTSVQAEGDGWRTERDYLHALVANEEARRFIVTANRRRAA